MAQSRSHFCIVRHVGILNKTPPDRVARGGGVGPMRERPGGGGVVAQIMTVKAFMISVKNSLNALCMYLQAMTTISRTCDESQE